MNEDRPAAAILLAIDGEPHSDAAVDWALTLAARLDLPVTAVHVKDPYLKQFENEIYAQGREEYLAHVDRCLAERAARVIAGFAAAADARGAPHSVLVLDGDPLEQLRGQLARGRYTALVLGRKRLTGVARWRSGDLPARLCRGPQPPATSIVIVPEDAALP